MTLTSMDMGLPSSASATIRINGTGSLEQATASATANATNTTTCTTINTRTVTTPRSGLISDALYNDLLVLWPILWLVILPPGLFANFLNIRTFLRMGLEDSVTISFFVLAVSDFGHLFFPLINVSVSFLVYLEKRYDQFFSVQPTAMYVYLLNVATLFNTWTGLISTFLAVQRCLCIAMPFSFKSMFSKSRTWLLMAAFFVTAAIPSGAYIFGSYGMARVVDARNRTQYVIYLTYFDKYVQKYVDTIFYIFLNILCQVLSFLALIVMAYNLEASVRFRKKVSVTKTAGKTKNDSGCEINASKSCYDKDVDVVVVERKVEKDSQLSKERTAIVQVAILTAIYISTSLPKLVFSLTSIFVKDYRITGVYDNIYMISMGVRVTSDYVNSAVNFFVYHKYNTNFRKLCFVKSKLKRPR